MFARVFVTLRRTPVIVKRDARRNHIDDRETLVHQTGLEQRYQLLLVAEKLRATNPAPIEIARRQGSIGGC